MRARLAGVAGWLVVVAVVMSADAWDPLSSAFGVAIVATAAVALGAAIGRWWALLLAPSVLVFGLPQSRLEPLAVVGLLFASAIVAVLVAVGVLLRRLGEGAGWAGLAAIAVAVIAAGVGVYLDLRVVDVDPERPLTLDETTGRFKGVRPGSPLSGRSRLGRRRDDTSRDPGRTLTGELSGPSSQPAYERESAYDGVVVIEGRRAIDGLAVSAPGAQTRAGVGVGDSLAVARRRYVGLDCDEVSLGSDTQIPDHPYCYGTTPSGSILWFGGDPIDSLWSLRPDREQFYVRRFRPR